MRSPLLVKKGLVLAAGVLAASWAQAGGEVSELAVPAAAPAPIGAPGQYNESFCYSSYAQRSYVPGFAPQISTLFENPRVYPEALCVIATPYHQWAGVPGWFFGSPSGYLSSVPPGSHALAYERGELGITNQLARGYPQGMRVVEPVIKPVNGYCKPGGVLILSNSATQVPVATPLPAPGQSSSDPSAGKKAVPQQREK